MIQILTYDELESDDRYQALLSRELSINTKVEDTVRDIIAEVRKSGDPGAYRLYKPVSMV